MRIFVSNWGPHLLALDSGYLAHVWRGVLGVWRSFSGRFHQCVAGWGRRFGSHCFRAAEMLFVVCVVVDVGDGDVAGRYGHLLGGRGRRMTRFLRMTLHLTLLVDVLVSVARSEMFRLVSETQYLVVYGYYNGNHLPAPASAFLMAGQVRRAIRRNAEF